ncbi:MAG TPA: BTAD domain-containing putative transcriptional regulator [Mycobacteriales bacterium]
MRVALLGPLEITGADGQIRLTGAKQHALLALLALDPGRTVSVDRLLDGIWGDGHQPRDAVNALQHQVSRLREAVGGRHVVRRGSGYLLAVPADAVDVHRFERLAADGRAFLRDGDPAAAAEALRSAAELWRGAPLDGLPDHPWAMAETARLERVRADASDDRMDAELALGRHAELVGELAELVAADPLRERRWGQLMLARYRCGRQAEALETYAEVRAMLADEHGLDPGPELQRLHAAMLRHDRALALAPAAPRSDLPASVSNFIGRLDELAAVRTLVRDRRLATLTGPPGVGKTRLALEAGRELSGAFPDGVWLVELPPVADTAGARAAVSSALGVREPGPPIADERHAVAVDPVLLHLRDRRALLILDGCEHLVPELADLVHRMLAGCPDLHVLATSRESLGVDGETVWPVPPLDLPAPTSGDDPDSLLASEAVRLFEDRASRALPSFAVTTDTAAEVAALCRRLDGLPLAIELAAARVRSLPVSRITAGLDDRFRLLSGRPGRPATRGQSLRAALDLSYGLLSPAEQEAFSCLSVFSGACSLDAACFVGRRTGIDPADMVDLIASLVDKSLLTTGTDTTGEPRYGLLETLRAYGRDRLAERGGTERLRAAHREHYAAVAAAADAGLRGAGYRDWQQRVRADYDDLRAAFDGALADGEPAVALRLASSLWLFWAVADRHGEGCGWLEEALAAADTVPAEIRAGGLAVLCYLAGQRDDVARAVEAGELAVRLADAAGDGWESARSRQALALVLGAAGRPARAAELLAAARSAMEATGDEFWVAASDLVSAAGGLRAGRLDLVERRALKVLARSRRIGYEPFECWARLLLAAVAERRGAVRAALTEIDRGLAVSRRLGLPHYVAFAQAERGRLLARGGDATGAEAVQAEAVQTAESAGSPWFAALARTELAATLARTGRSGEASALLQHVRDWAESPGARGTRATFFTVLGGSPYARCMVGLGALAGDPETAEQLLRSGLDRAGLERDTPTVAAGLQALAAICADRERAAVLLGAAAALRTVAGDDGWSDPDGVLADLDPATRKAALARGRRMSLQEALALARA